mmetsp:Transcript_35953/g.80033  ORF Transcript_35953/g.80033 Transcript_35953/m.80033 type:complete len:419 (+) Transcript_35953:120-1376(+)
MYNSHAAPAAAAAGPVVVLDNGGGNIKVGFGGESTPRSVFPNCSAKPKGERQIFIGDMMLECKEISQLTIKRPMDRGYLVNWDLEREIWGRVFRNVLRVNARDCGLLLTEPLFNFPQVQAATEQIVFEEFGMRSFYAGPAPLFALRRSAAITPQLPASQAGAGVVLDAGFSFTHVVPFFDGVPLLDCARRINLGGKALTNLLKDTVSYRSLNMQDETYLVDHIKEQLCFVSQDVRADLRLAAGGVRSPHRREYVLPDGVNNLKGYVRELPAPNAPVDPSAPKQAPNPSDQVLVLNNERFMVPEALFRPGDIGLQQAGVAEIIVQAVSASHAALHPLLYSNVVLSGGLVGCPGFTQRLERELRPLVPDTFELGITTMPNPSLAAWEGMSLFVQSGAYARAAMTKAQYEETGGIAARQYR